MNQKLPPLLWLRAFEASARHLSFTHAAAELNLTQAAVSKQVKLLEHYLREPLFQRKPRSLVITKIGASYLPKVRDAFERLGAGTEEIFGNRRSEVLTVRSPVGFSVNWMAARLPVFFDQYPKVPVRFVSSVWADEFDKEKYDLDIQYGNGKWSGYQTDRLTWEVLEPVCSQETAAQMQTPADLQNQRLLHVIGYEEGWAVWLNAAGLSHINSGQGIQFDTSLLAFEVAASGGGVALGRSSMSTKELSENRLVRPFSLAVPVREAFYLMTPTSGSPHPHRETFRQWLLAQVENARTQTESSLT